MLGKDRGKQPERGNPPQEYRSPTDEEVRAWGMDPKTCELLHIQEMKRRMKPMVLPEHLAESSYITPEGEVIRRKPQDGT